MREPVGTESFRRLTPHRPMAPPLTTSRVRTSWHHVGIASSFHDRPADYQRNLVQEIARLRVRTRTFCRDVLRDLGRAVLFNKRK
jgi:hypothetical protein